MDHNSPMQLNIAEVPSHTQTMQLCFASAVVCLGTTQLLQRVLGNIPDAHENHKLYNKNPQYMQHEYYYGSNTNMHCSVLYQCIAHIHFPLEEVGM